MEEDKQFIEKIEPEFKYGKDNVKFFWKVYLKKSWSIYLITGLFTLGFAIWYVLNPFPLILYIAIFYPIGMVILFFLNGIYKNLCHKKECIRQSEGYVIKFYSTFVSIQMKQNGMVRINQFQYDRMKSIQYKKSTEQIVFEINPHAFLSIDKSDIQESTFEFLSTMIKN